MHNRVYVVLSATPEVKQCPSEGREPRWIPETKKRMSRGSQVKDQVVEVRVQYRATASKTRKQRWKVVGDAKYITKMGIAPTQGRG